jgi:hypothetical protein
MAKRRHILELTDGELEMLGRFLGACGEGFLEGEGLSHQQYRPWRSLCEKEDAAARLAWPDRWL